MIELTKEIARRYVLGRQGLWPGRRWAGPDGVAKAIRAAESVQVDTISIVARNHDLVLSSRVADYAPSMLDQLLYTERQFFEYGWILFIYPLDELPYWLSIMARKGASREWLDREHPEVIALARQRLEADGPLTSRDFKGRSLVPGGFNVVKDVAHGLDYLWISGQIMIHSRRGNDRVYDLTERLVSHSFEPVNPAEAEYFFVTKALRDLALASRSELSRRLTNMIHRRPGPTQVGLWLERMVAEGIASPALVEDRKETLYFPTADLPRLGQLAAGHIPAEWMPLGPTTQDEVALIAPLDNVIWDRTRAKTLFDFDYIWEVYKPQAQRRWGYYTLPILYGDRLVARLDPQLDRKTGRLRLLGFWLDDPALADDPAFARALAAGLRRFAHFHSASEIDPAALAHPLPAQALAL